MGGSGNESGTEVPIRLVNVNQAGTDPATRIPPEEPGAEAPDEETTDAGPFAADETDASDFEKNLASLRAGDSGQTFTGVAEPGPRLNGFEDLSGDGD